MNSAILKCSILNVTPIIRKLKRYKFMIRKPRINQHSQRIILYVLLALALLGVAAVLMLTTYFSARTKHLVSVNGSVRAIDSANVISDPSWFKKAYDDGFRLYILHSTAWGTCNPWYATEPQLKMALEAGLKVAVYTRDPRCWREGILAAGGYATDLQFFALDAETHPGIPISRAMVDGVRHLGVRPVIYTGAAMWSDVQNGSTEDFSDVPLWDADTATFSYSEWQANYLSPSPVTYAGWNTPKTMRVGVQQQFEYSLNGVNVDLNSFDSKFLQ